MKIPQLDLTNFELPTFVNDNTLEFGIPAQYLIQPINSHIRKYEGLIKDSESEKVKLEDLVFCLREGGFVVKGNISVQVRKLLGEAPILGTVYTPWITVNGSFAEDLTIDIVEGRLNISHSQLHFSCTDERYQKLIIDFISPYLEKEVIRGINNQISSFNGLTLEELLLNYGKAKIQQKLESKFSHANKFGSILKFTDNINKIQSLQQIKNKLKVTHVNVRVTEQHLWLSLAKR